MKRSLSAAIIAALLVVCPASAQFDLRSIGTQTMTYQVFKQTTLPSVSKTGESLIVMDSSCGCLKVSMAGGAWQLLAATGGGGGAVTSIFGRGGTVVANYGDYLASQVQAVPFNTITGTNVQTQLQQIDARISSAPVSSVFGRTGAVSANTGDYTASKITNVATGSISSIDVQAAINELATEKVDRTVANTYTASQTYSSPSLPILIKPSSAPSANAKLLELRTTLDASLAWWDAEGDETVNSIYDTSGSIDTLTALTLKTAGVTRVTINSTGTALSGDSTATTAAGSDNDTSIATTGFVRGSFAYLPGSNTFTGTPQTIGAGTTGTNVAELRINSGNGAGAYSGIFVQRNSLSRAAFGVAGGANHFISGSVADDLNIYSTSRINFSADAGVTRHAVLDGAGNFGIGGAPSTPFEVFGTMSTFGARRTGIRVFDRTSMAAGVGSGITFGGYHTGTSALAEFAGITGTKVNSTPADLSGKLSLWTSSPGGAITEAMQIDQNGNVGIGVAPVVTGLNLKEGARVMWPFGATNAAQRNWAFVPDSTVYGDFAIYTSSSKTAGQLDLPRLYIDTSGNVKTQAAVYERSRTTAMGEWIAFTPAIVCGTGGGTFTTTATNAAQYTVIGKTMHLMVGINGTVNTAATANLQFTIPGGFSSSVTATTINAISPAGAVNEASVIQAVSTTIVVARMSGTLIPVGANTAFWVDMTIALN